MMTMVMTMMMMMMTMVMIGGAMHFSSGPRHHRKSAKTHSTPVSLGSANSGLVLPLQRPGPRPRAPGPRPCTPGLKCERRHLARGRAHLAQGRAHLAQGRAPGSGRRGPSRSPQNLPACIQVRTSTAIRNHLPRPARNPPKDRSASSGAASRGPVACPASRRSVASGMAPPGLRGRSRGDDSTYSPFACRGPCRRLLKLVESQTDEKRRMHASSCRNLEWLSDIFLSSSS